MNRWVIETALMLFVSTLVGCGSFSHVKVYERDPLYPRDPEAILEMALAQSELAVKYCEEQDDEVRAYMFRAQNLSLLSMRKRLEEDKQQLELTDHELDAAAEIGKLTRIWVNNRIKRENPDQSVKDRRWEIEVRSAHEWMPEEYQGKEGAALVDAARRMQLLAGLMEFAVQESPVDLGSVAKAETKLWRTHADLLVEALDASQKGDEIDALAMYSTATFAHWSRGLLTLRLIEVVPAVEESFEQLSPEEAKFFSGQDHHDEGALRQFDAWFLTWDSARRSQWDSLNDSLRRAVWLSFREIPAEIFTGPAPAALDTVQ
ncbi:MAG: hypothetical protein J5J00_16410 [Deltaproteobacteria bacterium]|nr:hypothetical protein [Deltaproteobacteria bacterium]